MSPQTNATSSSDFSTSFIAPGGWLGILGGGQLGRFLAIQARHYGYKVAVWSPGEEAPAAEVADFWSAQPWDDATTLELMAHMVDVVTLEFENVPVSVLEGFEAKKLPVRPGPAVLRVTQDRREEKSLCQRLGLQTAPWVAIASEEDAQRAADGMTLPGLLKTARDGYDGKGQRRVNSAEELLNAWNELGEVPCVLEGLVPFKRELSLLGARGLDGQVVTYPLIENVHERGILATSTYPADDITPELRQQAESIITTLLTGLNYVGLLAVELFETTDGQLLVNEMAPRPHNSGHLTLDAFSHSQYDLQLRAITGLPLVEPKPLVKTARMENILGDAWPEDGEPDWTRWLGQESARLYLYGKSQPKPGRKMGHCTWLN